MLGADLVIATGIAYVGLLFLIAYLSDRRARKTQSSFLRSPFVYTLAISVYCTSWTFYGAVGSAARNGLEYLAIYLGPTIVFIGWWFVLRRLVRISHNQRITSIADLLSSRFGKSSRLAVLVTVIAVIGIAPYIALQLKAVTSSIQAVSGVQRTTRISVQLVLVKSQWQLTDVHITQRVSPAPHSAPPKTSMRASESRYTLAIRIMKTARGITAP